MLGLIAQLSGKVSGNLNLTPKPGGARKSGDDGKSSTQSGAATPSPAAKAAVAAENFAHATAKPEALKAVKLDVATMKLYSNALDEMDKKNTTKAIALLKQVHDKFPEFEPANRNLEKLGQRVSH